MLFFLCIAYIDFFSYFLKKLGDGGGGGGGQVVRKQEKIYKKK